MHNNIQKQQGSILILALLLTTILTGLLYILLINMGHLITENALSSSRIHVQQAQDDLLIQAKQYLQTHWQHPPLKAILFTREISNNLIAKATLTSAQTTFNLNAIGHKTVWLTHLLKKRLSSDAQIYQRDRIYACISQQGHFGYTLWHQLDACPGIKANVLSLLRKYTSLLPQDASININLARLTDLNLLFPKLSEQTLKQFVKKRNHLPRKARISFVKSFLAKHPLPQGGKTGNTHSKWFYLTSKILASNNMYYFRALLAVHSMPSNNKKKTIVVLWQREGSDHD